MKTYLKLSALIYCVMTAACAPTEVEFQSGPSKLESNQGDSKRPTPLPRLKNSETFNQQVRNEKLDILIVDDNSASMEEEQEQAAQKFSTFISAMSGIDWHVAITTTDVYSENEFSKGRLAPMEGSNPETYLLTSKIPDYETIFGNTIRRKEGIGCTTSCPSNDERPLMSTVLALQNANSRNTGFFREDAHLAIIIMSDEDEASNGKQGTSPYPVTEPEEVIGAYNNLFPNGKGLSIYGITVVPGDTDCYSSQVQKTYATYGNYVFRAAQLTGGIVSSICSEDYGNNFKSIARSVQRLMNSIELQEVPDPKRIKINLTPRQFTNWWIDGRYIVFDRPPILGTRIDVEYDPID